MRETVVHIENIGKTYTLGVIGSGSLRGDLQSFLARIRGKEDPNGKLGAAVHEKGERFRALDGVSLDIYQGDTIGIIGRNGAGKSTLLKILSRVTAPTEGRICVRGRVASMLEVGTGFHRELTGRENIYLNGAIMGMSRREVDDRMEEIIEFSEIGQFIDTPVKRYSSGMYVKLAFSVAAHLNADILVMDEVLAVGDAVFRKKCIDKIRDLAAQEDKTVIFVSHDMASISQLCNRCAVLSQGKILYDGEVDKAISLYYSDEEDSGILVDLDRIQRPRDRILTAHMLALQFLDVQEPSVSARQGLHCRIRWENREKTSHICFRITLNHNGTPVGTYLSPSVEETLEPGIYETEFTLDSRYLTPGDYVGSIAIHRYTEEGLHSLLDYVGESFSFRISKGRIPNKGWNHRFWGSVLLPDMQILGNRKCES